MKEENDYPSVLRPLDHLNMAEDFLVSYTHAHKGRSPDWPRFFLACHAVELVLKAFLLQRGLIESDLSKRNIRHNIALLYAKAEKMGLNIDVSVKEDILCLHDAHKCFWHRYPRMIGTGVFTIDQFGLSIEKLFSEIRALWNKRQEMIISVED